jgi:hypothetical protein
MRYTCKGDVRGDCGIKHRTLETALACLERDMEGCASQGGYSDRDVVSDNGEVWNYCEGCWKGEER